MRNKYNNYLLYSKYIHSQKLYKDRPIRGKYVKKPLQKLKNQSKKTLKNNKETLKKQSVNKKPLINQKPPLLKTKTFELFENNSYLLSVKSIDYFKFLSPKNKNNIYITIKYKD